jgi:hypothetical protein
MKNKLKFGSFPLNYKLQSQNLIANFFWTTVGLPLPWHPNSGLVFLMAYDLATFAIFMSFVELH